MTQRNTQRGDAMAIGMIVLAIALVATVGFIAWQNFGKKDDDKKVAETTQDAKKDDKKPATEEKKEAVLTFADWGVEMPVTDELKGVHTVKVVSEYDGNVSYHFTVDESVLLSDTTKTTTEELGSVSRVGKDEKLQIPGLYDKTPEEAIAEGYTNVIISGNYGYVCQSTHTPPYDNQAYPEGNQRAMEIRDKIFAQMKHLRAIR